jgi:hypothetical protein
MPLYYFHLRDGVDHLLDPEGSVLADPEAALARAIVTARSLISADALEGQLRLDLHIDVEDEAGTVIHRLPFAEAIEIVPPAA